MDALFHPAADFIARHAAWAGVMLGVVTLLESLVFLGAFVPATALMIMAGGLIAAGDLAPAPVILWCVGGAIIGDALSYEFGRRLGPSTLRRPAFRPHRRNVARTRLFIRKHGAASIFIGRFFGPLRAFVPLGAGLLEMDRRTFQTANSISAVIWVLVLLTPGYFSAKGLKALMLLWEGDRATIVLLAALAVLAAGFAAREALKRRAAQPVRRR